MEKHTPINIKNTQLFFRICFLCLPEFKHLKNKIVIKVAGDSTQRVNVSVG